MKEFKMLEEYNYYSYDVSDTISIFIEMFDDGEYIINEMHKKTLDIKTLETKIFNSIEELNNYVRSLIKERYKE